MTESRAPDMNALAGKLTDLSLESISSGTRLERFAAREVLSRQLEVLGDLFCEAVEEGRQVHSLLLDRLRSDMEAVYLDTGGDEVLRAGVITLWEIGQRLVVVDGRHRLGIAAEVFPEVLLPCKIVQLSSWSDDFAQRLLVPHMVLSNLVSRTLSDELRIVVLAKAVEYLYRSHLAKGVIPSSRLLVDELSPYWGDSLNEAYIGALLRGIDYTIGDVLPRSLGGRGKPLTPVGPMSISPRVQALLDGDEARVAPFPKVHSLRELLEWSKNPTREPIGKPAQSEKLHFRIGYAYDEATLKSTISSLQERGFRVASYIDLNRFADWAYAETVRRVLNGEVRYDDTLEFIGRTDTPWFELVRDNPCPVCKSTFWVQYDQLSEHGPALKCIARRHFVQYPNGLRFGPKPEQSDLGPSKSVQVGDPSPEGPQGGSQ